MNDFNYNHQMITLCSTISEVQHFTLIIFNGQLLHSLNNILTNNSNSKKYNVVIFWSKYKHPLYYYIKIPDLTCL